MRFVALTFAAALAGAAGAPAFTTEQAKATIEDHVERTVRESGGVYRLTDPAGNTLELEFVHVGVVSAGSLSTVHAPERRVDARAFFACTRFHPVGAPEGKLFDVDMVVQARDGALAVTDVRLHQETHLVDGKWTWGPLKTAAGTGSAGKR